MRKRTLYALLCAVPGLAVAFAAALAATGAVAGIAWLYLFGDDPWPATAEPALAAFFAAVWLAAWITAVAFGYRFGRARESRPTSERRAFLCSILVTLALLGLIVLPRCRVGNPGARSASELCSDYCGGLGFAASGLAPEEAGERICSCYGEDGRAAAEIPLERLRRTDARQPGAG